MKGRLQEVDGKKRFFVPRPPECISLLEVAAPGQFNASQKVVDGGINEGGDAVYLIFWVDFRGSSHEGARIVASGSLQIEKLCCARIGSVDTCRVGGEPDGSNRNHLASCVE